MSDTQDAVRRMQTVMEPVSQHLNGRHTEIDPGCIACERDQAVHMLADTVVKATEYGVQDGEFVANYLLPTGPIHRAIPWLEQRGIIVRPGFGDKPGFDGRAEAVSTDG